MKKKKNHPRASSLMEAAKDVPAFIYRDVKSMIVNALFISYEWTNIRRNIPLYIEYVYSKNVKAEFRLLYAHKKS